MVMATVVGAEVFGGLRWSISDIETALGPGDPPRLLGEGGWDGHGGARTDVPRYPSPSLDSHMG